MVQFGILWDVMVYSGIFYGILWHIMVYHGIILVFSSVGPGPFPKEVSNATPTTLDMVCTFTFPCPAGATPEEVTTSMRTITTRSFLSILAPKLAGLGHEPFAFTATAFMGAAVVTTASPSPTNSTTSFIPIASTLPATTTTEAPKMDFHPCKSLEDYMPEAKMSVPRTWTSGALKGLEVE